jgi:hypothetical protein
MGRARRLVHRVDDGIRGQTSGEKHRADRLEDLGTLIEALVSSASEGRECIVVVHDASLEELRDPVCVAGVKTDADAMRDAPPAPSGPARPLART